MKSQGGRIAASRVSPLRSCRRWTLSALKNRKKQTLQESEFGKYEVTNGKCTWLTVRRRQSSDDTVLYLALPCDQTRSGCTGVTAARTKPRPLGAKSHRSMRQQCPVSGPFCAWASPPPEAPTHRTRFTELGASGRVRDETAVPA